jgi:peptidoglycan-N-acetylglucosamine deacetylase
MKCDTRILQLLFPSVLFTTTVSGIHLTFDDGPHPVATPAVLKILKARDIRSTFFLLGQNVRQYPEIAQQIVAEGHQIGNHSYTHTNLFFKNEQFVQKEIIRTEEVFASILGKHSQYFRPPYGYFNIKILNLLKKRGSTCVLWCANSKDFSPKKHSGIERRIVRQTGNGSILLFHDNMHTAQTVTNYLPKILDTLLAKRFVFKELPS